jgi:hypothetical protein
MRAYKFIFLFLILASCGSRKVAIDKIDTVVKVDSTSTIKKDEVVVTQNNVSINTDTDEMEICPISDTIPMVVNGITYKNAKIKRSKKKNNISIVKDVKVQHNAQKSDLKVVKSNRIIEVKQTERKESYWWLLWFLLLIPAYYLWRKYKIFV